MADRDKQAVDTMSSYVNSMCSDYEEFAKHMSCEHRTLQQNFTKLCIAWLKQLAQTEYYDLRNEASVKFAQSIQDKIIDLPCI